MNKFVILYPEILSSVIRNNEEDLFCIWLLCKHFNTNNSGLFELNKLIEISQNNLHLNSNHIYKKIRVSSQSSLSESRTCKADGLGNRLSFVPAVRIGV